MYIYNVHALIVQLVKKLPNTYEIWGSNPVIGIESFRKKAEIFKYLTNVQIRAAFFFFPVKKKLPVKAIFGLFSNFFTGNFCFSRAIFCRFLSFFTGKKLSFTGKNLIFFWFHGQLCVFTGKNLIFLRFHGQLCTFTGNFSKFFHGQGFGFHGEKKNTEP